MYLHVLRTNPNSENGTLCAIKEVKLITDDHISKECLKQLNQVNAHTLFHDTALSKTSIFLTWP